MIYFCMWKRKSDFREQLMPNVNKFIPVWIDLVNTGISELPKVVLGK